jgi:hypothetical protein
LQESRHVALAAIWHSCQQVEHVAAKLNDFADDNMLQVIKLARFLSTWTIPSKWKARWTIETECAVSHHE